MKIKPHSVKEIYLYVFIIIIITSGLLSYSSNSNSIFAGYNLLPSNLLFEIFTLSLIILNIKKNQPKLRVILAFILFFYFIFSFFKLKIASNFSENINDFLLIYKSFIYIFLLSFDNKKFLSSKSFVKIYYIFAIAFFIKYIVSILFFSIQRPGIFTENNFELFILIIPLFYFEFNKIKINKLIKLLIIITIFISGSRSAQGCFLFMYMFIYENKSITSTYIKYFSLLIFMTIFYIIFESRLDGNDIESIDRYKFFLIFTNEISNSSIFNFLFGQPIITPLSDISCSALSYYTPLFSTTTPGVCFSVILHSFIMRTIFDHGVLGLFFIILFYIFNTKKHNLSLKFSIFLTIMVLLNGLSVSSFNSIYFIFTYYLMISINIEKTHQP